MTSSVLERLLAAMNERGLCASDGMVALAVIVEQGLRVIGSTERRVLGALSSVSSEELRFVSEIGTIALGDACQAELCRRDVAAAEELAERAALSVL